MEGAGTDELPTTASRCTGLHDVEGGGTDELVGCAAP